MPVSPISGTSPFVGDLYSQATLSRRPAPDAAPPTGSVAVETPGRTSAAATTPCCADDESSGRNNSDAKKKDPARRQAEDHELKSRLELTPEEKQELQELRRKDREVRAHEQAHVAAGGRYVRGGASYDYEKGPDGRQYAVGGEVAISAGGSSGDPQKDLEKARTVKRAALAPAQPSPQDRKIAARAAQEEAQARTEILEEKQEEAKQAAEGAVPASSLEKAEPGASAPESGQAPSALGPPGEAADRSSSVPEVESSPAGPMSVARLKRIDAYV